MPQIRIDGGLSEVISEAESIWRCCLAHPGLVLRARTRHTAESFDLS
jgi:hypothetical protein